MEMDMPISRRPSLVSYADKLDFFELLEKLSKSKQNGFVRVTSGSKEGYILFKEGEKVAASYDGYSKFGAIEKIKIATNEDNTVIEVFDLRPSYVDYLIDVNKQYLMDTDIYNVIDKLKKSEEAGPKKETNFEPEIQPRKGLETGIPSVKGLETKKEIESSGTASKNEENNEYTYGYSGRTKNTEKMENQSKTSNSVESNSVESNSVESNSVESNSVESNSVESKSVESKSAEESERKVLDRSELMKKYGIKEIKEEDVGYVLEAFKSSYLSNDDIERIELDLMKGIKRPIMKISQVQGVEVMVFLDNTQRLSGTVRIIVECKSRGLFSRLMGESTNIEILRHRVIEIVQMEIRKISREYPEIRDVFDINVEIG
jgi:hypothetical protein